MGSRHGPKARDGVSWLGVAISLTLFPSVPPPVNCTPLGYVGQELTAGPECQDSCLVL